MVWTGWNGMGYDAMSFACMQFMTWHRTIFAGDKDQYPRSKGWEDHHKTLWI